METDIGCRELFSRLGDDDVLVVDCSSDEEWERLGLHVPGALRVSPAELAETAEVLPDDELIVLCGCAPDGSDARRIRAQLSPRGLRCVCLSGGLRAWVAEGFPVERHGRRPAPPASRH